MARRKDYWETVAVGGETFETPNFDSVEWASVSRYRRRYKPREDRVAVLQKLHDAVARVGGPCEYEATLALTQVVYEALTILFLRGAPWPRLWWYVHRCKLKGNKPNTDDVAELLGQVNAKS